MARLKKLIDQLDEAHADMPAILREPGIRDADYETLWEAHKLLSKSLARLILIEQRIKANSPTVGTLTPVGRHA